MIIKLIFNVIVFIVSLLILCKASLWDVNWLNYESPIEYENYKGISLKDFKGLNRVDNTLDGMKDFAFIVTDIKAFKKENKYHVVSMFYPSRSYTFKKEFETDGKLLNHELYHFHITEYRARVLRKEIGLKNFDYDRMPDLKRDIYRMENSMQQLYDNETYHGYVLNQQIFWQRKVDSLLNCLIDFKGTEININH